MAEPPLTVEQQRAVEVTGPAAIRAGAGTGKTAVLAHRFLELLRPRDGAPPLVEEVGQLLAITFTDRAAAQMRARIRELLADELTAATGDARERWLRVRRELLGAQISTIHAFCARIVRENPLEAGLDPHAAVLDEHESRAYLETAVEEGLVARLRAGDAAVRDLLLRRRRLRGGRDGGAVGLCTSFVARLGTMGRDRHWLAEVALRQEGLAPAAEEAMRATKARVVAVVQARLAAGGRTRSLLALAEAWPTLEETLRRFGPMSPPSALRELMGLARLLGKAGLGADVKEDLALDGDRLRGTLAGEYGFLVALPDARVLAQLVGELADEVAARKRADAILTFDDLIAGARALLSRHPAVLLRYAGRFRALLVDEFQDTDAVQAEVIRQLAAAGATLFVVGDEKQSIYRFRGADVAVFHQVRGGLTHQLPLGTNFRSQPAILEFVNALATRTLAVPRNAVDPSHWTVFEGPDHLVADREQTWPRPGVRLVTFTAVHARQTLRVAQARELEGRVLAEVIADLCARRDPPVAYGDVAVLFRTLNQVKAYEYALRRREIPYYVVKGRGFFQCQEVRDVMNLLGAIADPRDRVALAAALRSPFFALDDDTLWRLAWPPGAERPWLARRFRPAETFADLPEQAAPLGRMRDLLVRLRRLRSRATIAELIEEALAATDFEAVCLTQFQGTQKVANVRKLIELARTAERRRFATLQEFVRSVRVLAEREAREPEAPLVGEQDDVVRLMTIHQAKGLEFPVVILVDLGRRLERHSTSIVLDDDLGILAAPVAGAGAFPLRHARLEEHRAREEDRERAESARLLYVACTRARDQLVLLEGKGEPGYLTDGRGDPHVWCHQVWDLLGRERVAAFTRGDAPEIVLALPEGGQVLVERAESFAGRGGAPDAVRAEPREAPATAAEESLVARVLGFTPPAPRETSTSPTELADFRRCPRQYWYRHVLGVPERGSGGLRSRLLGTAAHGVLETLDLDRASAADVAAAVAARPEALTLGPAELKALASDLTLGAAALRAETASGLEILGREVPFVLPLPAGAPRLFLQGRIDLLVRRGAAIVVRDYKYTRAAAMGAEQYGAQLGAYRLAVAAAGTAQVEAEVVFLRGGPVVRPIATLDAAVEEATLLDAGAELGAALARGEEAAFPRRPPGPAACERLGCGYTRRCWGTGVIRRASGPPTGSGAA